MARTGRPKARLEVTAVERGELERLGRRARTNRHVALRAKIVLRCARGESNVAVAAKLGCSNVTVGKWRQRFTTGRVDALYDEPKPGAPRTLSDADVESILVATLESKPKGRTHWSTRKMAERAGVSASTVGRIWRTFGLQPHIVESFKISDDPLFIEKVRDIVGLYLNPPDHAVVLSFDEKPQIQALERAHCQLIEGSALLPREIDAPDRFQQAHVTASHSTNARVRSRRW